MRAIVFGGSGFLGRRVVAELRRRGIDTDAPPRRQLDLTDYGRLREYLTGRPCELLFNCAALTDLDYCERCPPRAGEINWLLPGLLARWSRANLRTVHVTTDYAVEPVQEYGRQKALGEEEFWLQPGCVGIRLQVRLGGLYDADRGLPAKIMRATAAAPMALIQGRVGLFMPADWAAARIVEAAIPGQLSRCGRVCLWSDWQNPWQIGCELRGLESPAIVRLPIGRQVCFPARPTHGQLRHTDEPQIAVWPGGLPCPA